MGCRLFKGLFNNESPWRRADREARNASRIHDGLFKSDPTKNFWGRIWEVVSRFTWQGIQTAAGYVSSHASNIFGTVTDVNYYGGATVVKGMNDGLFLGAGDPAVTLGNYIIGDRTIDANPNNSLFQHEYGHYLQSQEFGFAYLTKIGLPNAQTKRGFHNTHRTEQDANVRAFRYFNNNDPNFSSWNFADNPIIGYRSSQPFNSTSNQLVLDRGLISFNIVDYMPFFYGNWQSTYYYYYFKNW